MPAAKQPTLAALYRGISLHGVTEFGAALAGALVGGIATFLASWWQTKRVLQHEAIQARAAAEEERAAARHSVSRSAVVELLGALAELERVITDLGRHITEPLPNSNEVGGRAQQVTRALDLLAHAQTARAPLLPDRIQERWRQLRILVNELHAARPVATDAPDRGDWTQSKIDRAREDAAAYLAYVHRSLVALINEEEMPRNAAAPNLRRVDMAVWIAPDEGGLSA